MPQASMGTFTFHGWLVVEIFTDDGPRRHRQRRARAARHQAGDRSLSEAAAHRRRSLGHRVSVAAHVSQDDGVRPQGHRHGRDQRRGHRAVGHSWANPPSSPSIACSADGPSRAFRSMPAGFTARRSNELAAEAKKYKDEGYKAMKLRFGWGPVDGAAGMQHNVDLVRTVRETVGDGVDIMADAYMGWTLDYAKRMIPLLEPFNLRWLEEAGDSRRHSRLRRAEGAYGRIPIAGGEHEFTHLRFPRTARSARRGLHPVRHQSRGRHHAGAQDRRAGRGAFGAGDPARRARCTTTTSSWPA